MVLQQVDNAGFEFSSEVQIVSPPPTNLSTCYRLPAAFGRYED